MTQSLPQSVLIIGLGNPGSKYEMTRHNLGYLVVQAFAKSRGWLFKKDLRFNALVAKGIVGEKNIHMILPLTYMNLSGESVRRYVDYYKIALDGLVVVSDDLALDFGKLRLKKSGSAGGHNGLKSVELHLGTTHYMRLRMGIGHPGENVVDYVLENFSSDEQKELQVFIERGKEVLEQLLRKNVSLVMNEVNTILVSKKENQEASKETIDLTKPPLIGRGE